MSLAFPILIGLLVALLAITPPGLINMTAAKISLQEGKTRAFIFALGATIVILIQTFLAVIFARFIDFNPEIVLVLRGVGLGIFLALTFYFFWTSKKFEPKKNEIKLRSKKNRFFLGMLLSALNFFPIPFYVFISVTLASYNYFIFQKFFIYSFVIGTGLGSYLAFYCYISLFKKFENKVTFIINNMNYIIGAITGLVSVLTLINIINTISN
jgi:threonine/homoserine/homoserine lactone efflux protein